MEPNAEPSFDESVAQVMQSLPPVIRNYLEAGKYSEVAGRLMTTYGLHVDQGGVLEREIMLLLMGIDTPDEFTQALEQEAMLDRATINNITKDVNEQIFLPLREQMRTGATAPARPTPKPVVETPRYAAPALVAKSPQVQSQAPQYSPNRMLEDHEEPHIEIKMPAMPTAAPVPPKQSVPPNLPGQMPVAPPLAPNPQQWASNTNPRPLPPPPPRPQAPVPPPPPYSVDPYREPVE